MERLVVLLVILHAVSAQSGLFNDSPTPLHFSFFVSFGEFGYNSSGVIPSVDIALESIERNQILPQYNLTYGTVRNTKVGTVTVCL